MTPRPGEQSRVGATQQWGHAGMLFVKLDVDINGKPSSPTACGWGSIREEIRRPGAACRQRRSMGNAARQVLGGVRYSSTQCVGAEATPSTPNRRVEGACAVVLCLQIRIRTMNAKRVPARQSPRHGRCRWGPIRASVSQPGLECTYPRRTRPARPRISPSPERKSLTGRDGVRFSDAHGGTQAAGCSV